MDDLENHIENVEIENVSSSKSQTDAFVVSNIESDSSIEKTESTQSQFEVCLFFLNMKCSFGSIYHNPVWKIWVI